MDTFRFPYFVEHGEDGWYVGSVPALPECHTQGRTVEELRDNLKEAVELYLENMTEEEKAELNGEYFVEEIEVAA